MTETTLEMTDSQKIDQAYNEALAFSPADLKGVSLNENEVAELAAQEVAYGRISVDDLGWTSGMKARLVPPIREAMTAWDQKKGRFMMALQPYMEAIQAVEKLLGEVEKIRAEGEEAVDALRQEAEIDIQYKNAREELKIIEQRYNEASIRAGHRKPNMMAYNPLYWGVLFMVGISEWLINYETFFQFFHVPAMAAGTTIILGLLLAFSAHGHGTILRQWTIRFGQDVHKGDRWGDYRLLILSTLAVTIVVGAAGGSRYAWAMNALAALPTDSIIPGVSMPQVNPLRDVLLSLLGNVGAWIVGVFVAYLFHDRDPHLMDWTRQLMHARKRVHKLSGPYDDRMKTAKARAEKNVTEVKTKVTIQAQNVESERVRLNQVREHEKIVRDQLAAIAQRNAQSYQHALCQSLFNGKREVEIKRDGQPLSPFDYQVLKVNAPLDQLLA
jgi:hypothetical protein